ncbi:MAG: hypothetical protein E6K14_03050 [Methanobacteriota archaeon]|nr:MAG: hypothetical protein E6K14_03050 [Euryarchaeota archaeon]
MSDTAGRNGAALSLLIVVSLVLGGLFASILALSPAARAAACDQVGGVITGDWTITTAQVCSGILYSVDGTININSGGSLTLTDGGLSFSKDQLHAGYALNVNAGGELVLDHSIVTTQTDAISPYVKLALTVSGANSRFKMIDGSSLKFPGWFNATGATLNISSSKITGFTDSEIAGLGIDTDDNNDAPTMSWASTSASVFASRIERLYEYTSGPNGTGSSVIGLTAATSLYAYDTYIGVDFSDVVGWHNTLRVDGTSNAYLYNVTIDRSQDPASMSDFLPAYVPTAAGGSIYLLRWAHVTAVDSTAFPVSGATIASTLSPSAAAAQYPDNGFATTPTTRTIWYLGRTSSGNNAWDQTDSSGTAAIPLYTDQITTASLPNAESFGNYEEVATYSSNTQTGGAFFPPYPAIDAADNNVWITVTFPIQVRTGPDLVLQAAPATMTVVQNQAFTVYALISNSGQTAATNAAVAAFPNGNRGNEVARATGINVAAGGLVNRSMSIPGMALTGPATLELIVDPDNVINEGGVAQEANNFANITLNVIPPPEGFTAILSPENGQSFEPGKALSVTGYVRDTASNSGLEGVPLTVELRSGSTLIATNSTVSGSQGFFIGTFTVPSGTQDGTYTVVVTPASSTISSDQRTISVKTPGSILNQIVPILGIPFWLLFIMIAAAVAVAIGVTMYWKVYGLGKMVECGECGAFIPEDATSCPKCGVEFEKDMAKCSNCQAWIPVDVKQCPECGVEFATGELEMADYQQKMRLQYDEVVGRFKEEASRQLGRSLSESEFQEWWRKQPTFLTYEDWLREEEEMRKMGSRPCPTCGTLNSVTARVCHKCGSLMRDQRPPTGGAGGGAVVAAAPRRPSPPGPGTSEGQGPQGAPYGAPTGTPPATATIGRRLFQRSGAPQPVVQKRVIKKPLSEGQEGSEGSEGSEKSEEDL